MSNTFKLLFHLRKPKGYKEGPQPIYLRITINGQRAEISIQRDCDPDFWNSIAGRMTGTKEKVKQLNAYLDGMVTKVYALQNDLIQNGMLISAEAIKNKLSGKEERARMLIPIFQNHNNNLAALVGKEYAAGTLDRYKTCLQHTIAFIKWKYSISDIDIRSINHEFITDYDFYLRSVKECGHNTTVKYLKNFKKIIANCLANGWIGKDPFSNVKFKLKEVERDYLSTEELAVLEAKEFSLDRITHVKDIFLFSCYTGLAYIDVKKLTPSNIVIGIDGKHWIHTHRTKTQTPSNIPLLPPAKAIIEKYKSHPLVFNREVLLPVSSNQKMNAYLKEIAVLCEIRKELTFHVARHTFATTVTLLNDVPIESVSKMLGHTNIRTTQHYAKILDRKVSSDMDNVFKKFEKESPLKIASS